MLVFLAIAVAAFILVAGSFLFGHEHDVGHEHDADHGVDVRAGEPTIRIFSTKVLGTLLMGFGAAGAIATYYGANRLVASLIGLFCGVVLSGLMYLILAIFYKQQASSLIPTDRTVGCCGTVSVSIGADSIGEIGLSVDGQYLTLSASSKDGTAIPKGQRVRVVRTMGSHVIVEKES